MLEGLTPPKKFVGSCKVGAIADTLSKEDRDILLKAVMDTDNWPVKTLVRALQDRGLQISDSPIYNHRNTTCACFRS